MNTYTFQVQTSFGKKAIQIVNMDLQYLQGGVDLVICSAFKRDYHPTPNSLICTLLDYFDISVEDLSKHPYLEMKESGVWISEDTGNERIKRIACLEIRDSPFGVKPSVAELKTRFDAMFLAIRLMRLRGIRFHTVLMPVLGIGDQGIDFFTAFRCLITECISCLHQVDTIKRIVMISRNEEQYLKTVDVLRNLSGPYGAKSAFISYSHRNQGIADLISSGFQKNGIKPWIDHEMIRKPDYADAIVQGIRNADVFLFLVSEYSLQSHDCLREVRNAAAVSEHGKLIMVPVFIQRIVFPPGFAYYLTGLDYLDISQPPVEEKAAELYKSIWRKIDK